VPNEVGVCVLDLEVEDGNRLVEERVRHDLGRVPVERGEQRARAQQLGGCEAALEDVERMLRRGADRLAVRQAQTHQFIRVILEGLNHALDARLSRHFISALHQVTDSDSLNGLETKLQLKTKLFLNILHLCVSSNFRNNSYIIINKIPYY